MLFVHFVFALIVALVMTGLFIAGLRLRSPWGAVGLFAVIFLFSWMGGIWLAPVGPVIFHVFWLPFLLAGLLAILLIAAVSVPEPEETTVELVDAGKKKAERRKSERVLNLFFWFLVGFLLVAITLRYLGV